jgi:uncharacterized protein YciI
MQHWIYFLRPTRPGFTPDTMTDEEVAAWSAHWVRFKQMLVEGGVVLVGPTLDAAAIGIAILEAPDEATARQLMNDDPTIAGGHATGELHRMRISAVRGRDAGTEWDRSTARF